jgi:hypothetical protein
MHTYPSYASSDMTTVKQEMEQHRKQFEKNINEIKKEFDSQTVYFYKNNYYQNLPPHIVFNKRVCFFIDEDDEDEERDEISFKVIKQGSNNGIKEKRAIVIRSQSQWDALEKRMFPHDEDSLPSINFNKHMAIAVFAGEKNTGGYSIKVDDITEHGAIEVDILETSPGKNCIVTQALTQPYQIVSLKKSTKSVSFDFMNKIRKC